MEVEEKEFFTSTHESANLTTEEKLNQLQSCFPEVGSLNVGLPDKFAAYTGVTSVCNSR